MHAAPAVERDTQPISGAELVRHFLAWHDAPCPGCGYNLRALTGTVCPECSAQLELRIGFAPDDGTGRRLLRLAFAWPAMLALASLVSWIVVQAVTRLLPPGQWPGYWLWVVPWILELAIGLAATVGVIILWRQRNAPWTPAHRRRWVRLCIASLVVYAILSSRLWFVLALLL